MSYDIENKTPNSKAIHILTILDIEKITLNSDTLNIPSILHVDITHKAIAAGSVNDPNQLKPEGITENICQETSKRGTNVG